jgi:hypothetical protein
LHGSHFDAGGEPADIFVRSESDEAGVRMWLVIARETDATRRTTTIVEIRIARRRTNFLPKTYNRRRVESIVDEVFVRSSHLRVFVRFERANDMKHNAAITTAAMRAEC